MLGKSEISTQSIKKKNITQVFMIKQNLETNILDTFRPMREVVLGEIRENIISYNEI